MAPPSEPNLSMAELRSLEKSLVTSGHNLTIPGVQIPPPTKILNFQPHLGAQLDQPA